jgi:hypothetical protein
MSLTASWGKCPAYHNPIVLLPTHSLYNEICPVRRDSCWYRNTDNGSIETQQPLLQQFAFLTMVMGLRSISEKNLGEWEFRLNFAKKTGYHTSCLTKQVWTDDGWKEEPITKDDLRSLVGLSTNADKMTRKSWFRHVNACLEQEIECDIRVRANKG